MFLKKVYAKSKLLFYGMVAFALCQLFINYKVGLTATPFLHYGMYSGPFPIYQSIEVWELKINGEKVVLSSFHPKKVENIIEPLRIYLQQDYSNSLYYSHIKRFLKLSIINDSASFISHVPKEQFIKWYKEHLTKLLGKDVNDFQLFQTSYQVNKSFFTPRKQSLLVYGSN
jgi:hypothetical protein